MSTLTLREEQSLLALRTLWVCEPRKYWRAGEVAKLVPDIPERVTVAPASFVSMPLRSLTSKGLAEETKVGGKPHYRASRAGRRKKLYIPHSTLSR